MTNRPWLSAYPPGVPADIDASGYASLVQLMEESFQKYAARTAYSFMGKDVSFGQTDSLSRAFAAYLQGLGLAKGDRVAIMMPNVPQYPVAVAAILRAGFVVVNVNPLYTPRELEHQLKDSGSKAIVIIENFASTLQQCIANTPVKHVVLAAMGDHAGRLKGALVNYVVRKVKKMVPAYSLPGAVKLQRSHRPRHPRHAAQAGDQARRRGRAAVHRRHHRRLQGRGAAAPQRHRQRAAVGSVERAGDGQGAEERAVHRRLRAAAVSHLRLHGRHDAVAAHRREADPDPQSARPAGGAEGAVAHTFHSFPAVNTLFNGLANHPDFGKVDWSNLKVSVGGGMAVQGAVAKLWLDKTGCPICEGYGLSETSPSASCNPVTSTSFTGTIGVPLAVHRHEVPGRRRQRSAARPAGRDRHQGPAGDGRLLAAPGRDGQGHDGRRLLQERRHRRDGRARLLQDRRPQEGHGAGLRLQRVPERGRGRGHAAAGRAECAVVGVPDDKTGEAVKLVIVKKDPALTEEKVREYCQANLTGYKRPR
jgi:long-chain acyl-CoA synthetase